MKILIHKPSKADDAFLVAVGFTKLQVTSEGHCSYELPPGWILQKLHTGSLDAFLIDGRENIRAELLGINTEEGYIFLPRTAYHVMKNPGYEHCFLVLCRSRINGTLIIHTDATQKGAEDWLTRAYPDWRDPAKHWVV